MNLSSAHLPRTARDLIALLGLPATLQLVERYKGRAIQIAHGRRARGTVQLQELAGCVGAIAARKLSAHYGGSVLYIPNCKRALLATRDAALQARFDALTKHGVYSANRAVALLVGEYDLVESSVWRALKRDAGEAAIEKMFADARQMGLFA